MATNEEALEELAAWLERMRTEDLEEEHAKITRDLATARPGDRSYMKGQLAVCEAELARRRAGKAPAD